MSKSATEIAWELAEGAERARIAGDAAASLALSIKSAEYLQLAKLLADSIAASTPAAQREG